MNSTGVLGVAIGAVFGLGLWIVISALPQFSAKSLQQKVAYLVADISEQAYRDVTELSGTPFPELGLGRMKSAVVNLSLKNSQTVSALARELTQANSQISVAEFRSRQWVWGLWGFAAGLVLDVVSGFWAQPTWLSYVVIPVVLAGVGFTAMRYLLHYSARERVKRIEAQLPAVWEFLSLSLSAGESMPEAVKRITQVGRADIVDEFQKVDRDIQLGIPLATALDAMQRNLHISALSRGIEQILGALNRGTPISKVLHEHARDAREDSKRRLLESAGKKEVLMLIPLVFLILPVTILFAVFPGLLVIQSGF